MHLATTTSDRIAALDVIRGVAVMGILLANLPAFGLPGAAYYSPLPAGGTGPGDRIVWALNFVFVEGKMRGLFTLLFGASTLLVVERARAAGEDAAAVHYGRMLWLFVFGIAHLYLFWWGDILAHYALVGSIAFAFARFPTGKLVAAGIAALLTSWLFGLFGAAAAFSGGAEAATILRGFGAPDPARMAAETAAIRGGFWDAARYRWEAAPSPLGVLILLGPETLGTVLLGMAGLRSGFLTGGWERRRYRRWAAATLSVGWVAFAAIALVTARSGFDPRFVFLGSVVLAGPFRVVLVIGYACLIILLMRPGGWLTGRIAAAGRAAFSNYLGTTLLMTFVFSGWGLGLFGRIGRAEMYWLAPLAWALMLAWSAPWLRRYRHGPLEWLWRSLSRRSLQPMRLIPPARN